jgi:hypothetical protein
VIFRRKQTKINFLGGWGSVLIMEDNLCLMLYHGLLIPLFGEFIYSASELKIFPIPFRKLSPYDGSRISFQNLFVLRKYTKYKLTPVTRNKAFLKILASDIPVV